MWAFIASLIAFGIVGWVFALRYRIALDRRLTARSPPIKAKLTS